TPPAPPSPPLPPEPPEPLVIPALVSPEEELSKRKSPERPPQAFATLKAATAKQAFPHIPKFVIPLVYPTRSTMTTWPAVAGQVRLSSSPPDAPANGQRPPCPRPTRRQSSHRAKVPRSWMGGYRAASAGSGRCSCSWHSGSSAAQLTSWQSIGRDARCSTWPD